MSVPQGPSGLRCCSPRQHASRRECLSGRITCGRSRNSACLRPRAEAGAFSRQVASVAADPLHPISGHALTPSQCMTPTALFIGAAGLVATFILKAKEKRASVREEPCPDASMANIPNDARHHQRVLAKARQATHITNAVAYNKSGEFTTAMLELAKALAENSICRTPALLNYNQEEMANLYRLHIRCTEQPPNFATLLQLQELLGLSQDEAEKIELELMTIPGAFAI